MHRVRSWWRRRLISMTDPWRHEWLLDVDDADPTEEDWDRPPLQIPTPRAEGRRSW
jgi:hypothetical protein